MTILREYAMQMVGRPYIWGGDDPILGFDCSGLVQELLASVGMDPPGDQTAQALYDHFLTRAKAGVQSCGALAFYGPSLKAINHVAMMIDDRRVIEAGGGTSNVLSVADAARVNAYVRVRLLRHRKDLLGTLMPNYPLGVTT